MPVTRQRTLLPRLHQAVDSGSLVGETREREGSFDLIRLFAFVAMGALILSVPGTGAESSGRFAAIGILGGGVMVGLLIHRFADPSRVDRAQNLLTANISAGVAIALPELWASMLVSFCVMIIGAAAITVRLSTAAALVIGTALLAVAGTRGAVPHWPINLLVAVGLSVATGFYYRIWARQRRETDRRYAVLADQARAFFWEVDKDSLEIRDVSGATTGALGWSRAELIGSSADLLVVAPDEAYERCASLLADEERSATVPMWHRDGSVVQIHTQFWGTPEGTIRGTGVDVTEVNEATQTIRWQSRHDLLTGLPNRDSLHEWLVEAVRQTAGPEPSAQGSEVALLLLDLDRFKDINDTLGHGVGDGLLCVLAERLSVALGGEAQIARVGGDEFGLVVAGPHVTQSEIRRIADEAAALVRQPVSIDGLSLAVTASMGIAVAQRDASAAELMRQADIAMYESKRAQSRYSFYAHDQQKLSIERLRLGAELDDAIDSGAIELWLQKKVDGRTGRVIGAEGLARWRHGDLGILPPSAFIDLVETSDAHDAFVQYLLAEGVRLARRMRELKPEFVMSINMTPRSIAEASLPRRLADLLVEHGVPPGALTLEITEREIVNDVSGVLDGCRMLRSLGVNISIDDFGTGWSSLERLRQLPINEVKIDGLFVQRIATSEEDRNIVRSIIDLSDSLGLECVAEGVEIEAHATALSDLGCRVLQGYYFGHPVPEDDFAADISL